MTQLNPENYKQLLVPGTRFRSLSGSYFEIKGEIRIDEYTSSTLDIRGSIWKYEDESFTTVQSKSGWAPDIYRVREGWVRILNAPETDFLITI